MKRKSMALALACAGLLLCAACGPAQGPAVTPTPAPDESWKQLYIDFFAQNVEPSEYHATGMQAYQLRDGGLLELDEKTREALYWIDAFALCDLDFDGVPELILNQGEVEKEAYFFTPRDGKVTLVGHCLSGNQEYTDLAALYRDKKTDEKVWYSESLTGTGAGSLYQFDRINPEDLTCTVLRSYTHEYVPQTDTYEPFYKLDGQSVEETTFRQAQQAFADAHEQLAVRPFIQMGDDPSAALQQAIEAYVAP